MARITCHGGPVFNKYNAQVYNIFWGSAWNDTSLTPWWGGTINAVSLKNSLISNFQTIANSDYHKGLWQYSNIKTTTIGGNVVHTTTALPSSNATLWTGEVEACINGAIAESQVPDPASFGESAWSFGLLDYRHIYVVVLPPTRRFMYGGQPTPAGGFAMRAKSPTTNTHYCYAAINPASGAGSSGLSSAQFMGQTWGHEIIHDLTRPYFYGGCLTGVQGCAEDDPSQASEYRCTGAINHVGGSSTTYRQLSGTSVYVDMYWSDKDNKLIAPGTGTSWTPPPGPAPPSPPPPPGSPPPPSPPPPPSGSETFDKLWIPFSNTNRIIIDTTPGFSVFCRVYPYTLAAPPTANHMRCIWQKNDDNANGATANIGPDGTVYFSLRKDAVATRVRTNPGAVRANMWHQLWFTYDKNTNTANIYVDNVKYNTSSTTTVFYNGAHSHWFIGNAGKGSTGSPFRGRIDDFRLYRNGIASTTAVTNMYENNFTIETIPAGMDYSVGIVGFSRVATPPTNNVFIMSDVVEDDVPPATPPPPEAEDGSDDIPELPGPKPVVCYDNEQPIEEAQLMSLTAGEVNIIKCDFEEILD